MKTSSLNGETLEYQATLRTARQVFHENDDCALRAISIAVGQPYEEIHHLFEMVGRERRKEPRMKHIWQVLDKLKVCAAHWPVDGKTVRTLHRDPKISEGRFLVRLSDHMLPIIDGCIHDHTFDSCKKVRRVWRLWKWL